MTPAGIALLSVWFWAQVPANPLQMDFPGCDKSFSAAVASQLRLEFSQLVHPPYQLQLSCKEELRLLLLFPEGRREAELSLVGQGAREPRVVALWAGQIALRGPKKAPAPEIEAAPLPELVAEPLRPALQHSWGLQLSLGAESQGFQQGLLGGSLELELSRPLNERWVLGAKLLGAWNQGAKVGYQIQQQRLGVAGLLGARFKPTSGLRLRSDLVLGLQGHWLTAHGGESLQQTQWLLSGYLGLGAQLSHQSIANHRLALWAQAGVLGPTPRSQLGSEELILGPVWARAGVAVRFF